MEQDKPKPRVKVFTRSQESCREKKPDKPHVRKWFNDGSIPNSFGYSVTDNQRNYFYEYRN